MEESRTQPARWLVSKTNGRPHLQLRVSPGNGEAPPHREEGEAPALSHQPPLSLGPSPALPSSYLQLSKRGEPRTAPPMGNAPKSLPQSREPQGRLRQRDSFSQASSTCRHWLHAGTCATLDCREHMLSKPRDFSSFPPLPVPP